MAEPAPKDEHSRDRHTLANVEPAPQGEPATAVTDEAQKEAPRKCPGTKGLSLRPSLRAPRSMAITLVAHNQLKTRRRPFQRALRLQRTNLRVPQPRKRLLLANTRQRGSPQLLSPSTHTAGEEPTSGGSRRERGAPQSAPAPKTEAASGEDAKDVPASGELAKDETTSALTVEKDEAPAEEPAKDEARRRRTGEGRDSQ